MKKNKTHLAMFDIRNYDDRTNEMEVAINEWLDEHPCIKILSMTESQALSNGKYGRTINILYIDDYYTEG